MSAVMQQEPALDLAEARRFLDLVAEGEHVTFQTFDDKAESKALANILHGDFEQHGARLQLFNERGAGIFWMVNIGNGAGRKVENVTGVRAVFVDLDDAPLEPVLAAGVEPHAVVESSPGKWHAYWLVTGCTLEQFKPMQKALAAKFNGDPSVNDLPRVMRVPGFAHRKGEPFVTRIQALAQIQPYPFADLVQRLALNLTQDAPEQPPGADPGAGGTTRPGGRNAALSREAFRLRKQGRTVEQIDEVLQAMNRATCNPPLAEDEVRAIAKRKAGIEPEPRFKFSGGTTADVIDADGTVLLDPPDFSDDRLALDFVQAYGAGHRWSPGLGWMSYTGIVWRRDDVLGRYDLARRVCRAAAAGVVKPDEQKRLTSAKTVNAVLSLAQSDQRIVVPSAAWDGAPMLLNTPAGIVDLRTGLLRKRRHDDFVTQAARVAPDFDASPELFERFMQDVFANDNELIDFMQCMLGYCLTGERREQMLFFWHGTGANGKSTLLDLVQWMLDSYSLKLPAAALMVSRNDRHPTELAQLRGKRMAISSELEEGQFWNEALIKELTGDEVLTARFMRQDFFEFAMTQKHVIVGNHKPRLRGGDPAIARRLVLVPFEVKFEGAQRDRTMLDKLKAEAPAILAWIIRGAVKWHREGLQVPERVRAAGADYLADHDDMALWMDECCVRIGDSMAGELYASFRHWKETSGEHAPSQKTWSQRLQLVPGVTRRRSSGIRYAGIQLNEREARRARYAA